MASCLLSKEESTRWSIVSLSPIVACRIWMVTSASSGSPKRWILSID